MITPDRENVCLEVLKKEIESLSSNIYDLIYERYIDPKISSEEEKYYRKKIKTLVWSTRATRALQRDKQLSLMIAIKNDMERMLEELTFKKMTDIANMD